jgi:hypothetical protein
LRIASHQIAHSLTITHHLRSQTLATLCMLTDSMHALCRWVAQSLRVYEKKELVASHPDLRDVYIYDDDPSCITAYEKAATELTTRSAVEREPTTNQSRSRRRTRVHVLDSVVAGAAHRAKWLAAATSAGTGGGGSPGRSGRGVAEASELHSLLYSHGLLRSSRAAAAAEVAFELVVGHQFAHFALCWSCCIPVTLFWMSFAVPFSTPTANRSTYLRRCSDSCSA